MFHIRYIKITIEMNIVHINHSDNIGGAAIAAYRLCTAMKRQGLNSKMLVYRNLRQNDSMVETLLKNKRQLVLHQIRNRIEKMIIKFLFNPRRTFSIPLLGFSIHKHPLVKQADVIILHWICSGLMTLNELEKLLSLGKPVYWMLHDSYPFTGGCHVFGQCTKYANGCNSCSIIKNSFFNEVIKKQLQRKTEVYSKPNLYFIGPSQWIVDCARNSLPLNNKDIYMCRNVIDTNIFRPKNVKEFKKRIGLSPGKKTILFISASIADKFKGWNFLLEALKDLPTDKYQCLILGKSDMPITTHLDTVILGYEKDDERMADIYNVGDVFVQPSLSESFSLVVAEAMSCGVPCVGFNNTAIPGLINHKTTGFLADNMSSKSIANGIRWICEICDYSTLSKECRLFVENNCSFNKVKDIYSVILK